MYERPLVSEGKGRDAMSVPWETCREVLGMSDQEEGEESEASCPGRMEDWILMLIPPYELYIDCPNKVPLQRGLRSAGADKSAGREALMPSTHRVDG